MRSTNIKQIEFFNISIIEYINFILIGISFFLTIPKINKKKIQLLLIYTIIFIVYLFLHIINIYRFDINIFSKANPSYIVEIYYIIRVYILPLLLITILYSNEKVFNKEYYLDIIKCIVLEISGLIIMCNIFRFSYSSYDNEFGLINHTNFLDVFIYTKKYKALLTCGLYNSANQISIILFMLLPINLYNLYHRTNISNLLLVLIQTISMIVIGTKVSALGAIILLIITLFIYLLCIIIKRETLSIKYLVYQTFITIITMIIMYISPFYKAIKFSVNSETQKYNDNQNIQKYISSKLEEKLTPEDTIFLLTNFNDVFKISNIFYKLYPIEKDIIFWKEIAKRDNRLNNNYRIIKKDILTRIVKRNNNKLDKLLGIGYTSNFIDIEIDYIYQYYLFGIIGTILLIGIYFHLYLNNLTKLIKEKHLKYKHILIEISPILGLVTCYFSGHLFGWTSPMIVLVATICIGRVNNNEGNKCNSTSV